MIRAVYAALVGLHPRAFRARFGAEMLCTFDEASGRESPPRLALDAAVSLMRQWLMREGIWKYPAALCGAAAVMLTGIRMPIPVPYRVPARPDLNPEAAPMEFFLVAALASLIAVSLTIVFCVYWFRMATRSRRASTR